MKTEILIKQLKNLAVDNSLPPTHKKKREVTLGSYKHLSCCQGNKYEYTYLFLSFISSSIRTFTFFIIIKQVRAFLVFHRPHYGGSAGHVVVVKLLWFLRSLLLELPKSYHAYEFFVLLFRLNWKETSTKVWHITRKLFAITGTMLMQCIIWVLPMVKC